MTSLSCQSYVISAYLGTSANLHVYFEIKNVVFNGEQKKNPLFV